MQKLSELKRIDFNNPAEEADHRCATDSLFGHARGKMFGVMPCTKSGKNIIILKAFSGQYNGIWEVAGWVPPLFNVRKFAELNYSIEKKIKQLSRDIEKLAGNPLEQTRIIRRRKTMSQELMKKIHGLYTLPNFRGQKKSLYDIFSDKNGIPTGTGDCCAPKLLGFAARNNLVPLGMAEFYWGLENKSKTRLHGHFYPACNDRCKPILGHMLCGLDAHINIATETTSCR